MYPPPLPSKWKADRAAVTSLCVSPDGKLLLSAGQTIKMWDLDTKEVYRVSPHANDTWRVRVTSSLTRVCTPTAEIHGPLHGRDDPVLRHHAPSRQQRALFPVWGVARSTAQCLVSAPTAGPTIESHLVFGDARVLQLFFNRSPPPTGKYERTGRTRMRWCRLP